MNWSTVAWLTLPNFQIAFVFSLLKWRAGRRERRRSFWWRGSHLQRNRDEERVRRGALCTGLLLGPSCSDTGDRAPVVRLNVRQLCCIFYLVSVHMNHASLNGIRERESRGARRTHLSFLSFFSFVGEEWRSCLGPSNYTQMRLSIQIVPSYISNYLFFFIFYSIPNYFPWHSL